MRWCHTKNGPIPEGGWRQQGHATRRFFSTQFLCQAICRSDYSLLALQLHSFDIRHDNKDVYNNNNAYPGNPEGTQVILDSMNLPTGACDQKVAQFRNPAPSFPWMDGQLPDGG